MSADPAVETVGQSIVSQLVRLALLVRLAALVAAFAALIGSELTPQAFAAVMLLAGTSFAGLTQPGLLEGVLRHPIWAMADVVVVLLVFGVLGVTSPLALAALSTALLVGVLFPRHVAWLLGGTLAFGYVSAAYIQQATQAEVQANGSLPFLSIPMTMLSLVWVGDAIRRIAESQRRLAEQLQLATRASAVADERSRLAREMHDSVAKSLQGVAMGAASISAWIDKDGARAQAEAQALSQGAAQAVSEARNLLTQMRTDEPLQPFHQVLEAVATAWGAASGHRVLVDAQPAPLPSEARYDVLAALREGLENIKRHAPGADVSITCRVDGGAVHLVLADDGPGFDPASVPTREAAGHFGLRGIQERLAGVGGSASIESAPGNGTLLRLIVPLRDSGSS